MATVPLSEVPRTATYTRAYDTKPGFMTLVSDGERITGAYAVGPEAGEWLQQATVAIRARIPLAVMSDVIQPFPTFSEAFLHALRRSRHGSPQRYSPPWTPPSPARRRSPSTTTRSSTHRIDAAFGARPRDRRA